MTDYNKITEDIIFDIEDAVSGNVYVGEEINEDFFHDEMPIYGSGTPDVLVDIHSAEEVAAVLKICNENKIPVLARGAGSGLTGAGVAIKQGVFLNDLAMDALSKGYLYPPDPGEKFATLGGNVSTNAGGMRAVKYGTTRDYVRSMQVVLPTGEITNFGAVVSKSSTGYDLKDLMIGSEGTLVLIT